MNSRLVTLLCSAMAVVAIQGGAWAEIAIPVITDPNNGVDGVSVFGGGPIGVDETANLDGNEFIVYSMVGGADGGGGFGFSISNGENGITSSEGGANVDIDNPNALDPAIAAVNGGGRLQNGNAIRVSAWFQQDPNDPITKEPSVEPVLKLELWKEYGSQNGDFTTGRQPTAGYGDRLWDTDINAPDPAWAGFNQSQASRIDVNNNGVIANGDSLTASLPPTTGGFEWILVESTMIIDDTPDDQGGAGFYWEVAGEQFQVDAVEEIRATMFVGEFLGTDLTAGGSFWADNLMFEVFADEATMLATPNTNPMPMPSAGLDGDYNEDGMVDSIDYAVWREGLGGDFVSADFDTWLANYGASIPQGGGADAVASVPEPASLVLLGLIASPLLGWRRR